MNESCTSNMMFCHKCKLLKWNVYHTQGVSQHKFMCSRCASEDGLMGNCNECGREGIQYELNKHGGYCHKCEHEHIIECDYCGSEIYSQNSINGICNKCHTGENKPCLQCGSYYNHKKLSSDGLCEKCAIKIHKRLRDSEINEVVECIECGRESLVNDLNHQGVCIYCYSGKLELEINRLKKRKKYAY